MLSARGSSGTGDATLSQRRQPVWRCPQGAALQPARPLRLPSKEFNSFGGQYMPSALPDTAKLLCSASCNQRSQCHSPAHCGRRSWQHPSAILEGLWAEGLPSLKAQTSNFCPISQIKAVLLDRGQDGELLHRLHCSHPLEGHLREGSSGCCLRRAGPQDGSAPSHEQLPAQTATQARPERSTAQPCRLLPSPGDTSHTPN